MNQNNPIDVNFHLQKSLEIFEKKSADKFWSNNDKGIKMSQKINFGQNYEIPAIVVRKNNISDLLSKKTQRA